MPTVLNHPSTIKFLDDHTVMAEHLQTVLGADDVEVAREAVAAIREVLPGHLLGEEGPSGMFELMSKANPDLVDPLDRLQKDHNRLRRMLASLEGKEGEPDELEACKEFARFLEVHEIRERAALEAAQRGPVPR